ncbi:hypothetical protein CONLIGDRAFT_682029 [Coniochaeta ligniaria NRRL 30616]|uniref:Uncharacterized protein n=1 Tax=Coniochaeta ligniaria NRRL 30616 TaxID=1408157 RepID=A0A1J7JH97_9PEZI|nr:hypothetical protein CONLIGDRAFT_682029 [Coniochaeta ligniaria NRRL 30616]
MSPAVQWCKHLIVEAPHYHVPVAVDSVKLCHTGYKWTGDELDGLGKQRSSPDAAGLATVANATCRPTDLVDFAPLGILWVGIDMIFAVNQHNLEHELAEYIQGLSSQVSWGLGVDDAGNLTAPSDQRSPTSFHHPPEHSHAVTHNGDMPKEALPINTPIAVDFVIIPSSGNYGVVSTLVFMLVAQGSATTPSGTLIGSPRLIGFTQSDFRNGGVGRAITVDSAF